MTQAEPTNPADTAAASQTARPAIHDARALTQGGTTAEIHLNGQTYTLRITRADKLILTK